MASSGVPVTGLELLCKKKVTVDFEAVSMGQMLAVIADSCNLAMRTPADGTKWRFVRPKVNPNVVKPPVFTDHEAELKHQVLLAKQGWIDTISAEKSLFDLADLARGRQKYPAARGYLAQIRALPESWFASNDTQIDIALARVEAQAGRRSLAHQLLDKTLRTLA